MTDESHISNDRRIGDRESSPLHLPQIPLDDLQRFTSNPLERCDSNVSCTSQDGGATFVPFGRGFDNHLHSNYIDFTSLHDMIRDIAHTNPNTSCTPPAGGHTLTPPLPHPQTLDLESPLRPIHNNNNNNNINSGEVLTVHAIPPPILIPHHNTNNNNNNNNTPVRIIPPLMHHPNSHSLHTPIVHSSHHTTPVTTHSPSLVIPSKVPDMKQHSPASHHSYTSHQSFPHTSPASQRSNHLSPLPNDTKTTLKKRNTMTELLKQELSIESLIDQHLLCKFFRDQNGSRYVQDKLSKQSGNELIHDILKHIIFTHHELLSLAQDIYGNYVIQMLFEIGSRSHHKVLITHLLKNHVFQLTHSFYGCRVIQTALDYIARGEAIKLIKELHDRERIAECILGQNAHHVVQKVLHLGLDVKHVKFIMDCVHCDIYFYAAHIFGCRVVQSLINYYHECILGRISSDEALVLKLSKSEYGNYVMQDMLALEENAAQEIQSHVKLMVFRNVSSLSKNKFGSNVVEKCVLCANDEERAVLLQQMRSKPALLMEMVHDRYGNYVVQRLLTHCHHKQQSKLIYLIEKHIPNLATLKYGKHIMEKVKKLKSKYKLKRYDQQRRG